MKRWIPVAFALAAILAARAAEGPGSPLILVSLDGFRWDYSDLFPQEAATLRALKQEGVSARALVPVFPSNTFPNHYSIVTGLYPAHHGIINNDFFDPEAKLVFRFNSPNVVHDSHWWGGEPIWVTAILQGRKAAASFWVGSESVIRGVRPTFWRNYDPAVTFETRLDELLGWMRLPATERPAVVTFYLEDVNGAGHRFGPATAEVAAAIRKVDTRIATTRARLREMNLEPNFVIVSDHGMTATGLDRAIVLDEIIDLKTVQVESEGNTVALRPLDGDAAALVKKFAAVPHVKACLAADLPARLHLSGNPRIAPVWVLPEEGWQLGTRANVERLKRRFPEKGWLAGDHGYDPALTTMRGIFLAAGPAFRRGVELPETENVHVYNLMCAVLKLRPAPNDGDDRLVRAALRD